MERMLQITNWDGIALDHLASRDIPQLIEQVCIIGCPTMRTSLGTPSYVRLLAETIVLWKLIKLLMIIFPISVRPCFSESNSEISQVKQSQLILLIEWPCAPSVRPLASG